jgi:hypothetical protein
LHPGFRAPANFEDNVRELEQQPKREYTPEEARRNQFMEKRLAEKQSALEGQSFKYLDIFDKQMREHKQA